MRIMSGKIYFKKDIRAARPFIIIINSIADIKDMPKKTGCMNSIVTAITVTKNAIVTNGWNDSNAQLLLFIKFYLK